ncbi:hypothetical protein [Pontibacter akesuensis]|uniref:Uncharacterized protein n=1 Tax=Pontibacter akesuensis TaxID=388950 RepID=A0A1I7JXF2_9BACT|nr:hypothetical protein [Pontibacter akesuensis]GHA76853.1 hypothetical protein GCM10007389_33570 [Pontibacter akesuensis]SFU89809.1 hypothetical protein SAMN04487941_3146 [Pontibacter akesuensis]
MKNNRKRNQKSIARNEVYPNIAAKELRRDITNLYLEEPDLIMDSPEELEAYLQKLYGKNYLDGLDIS